MLAISLLFRVDLTSTNMPKSLASLILLVLYFCSCPLLGQEEIKSFDDRPRALTAQLSYLGDIGSARSIAVERRRKSSTSKFRQSGIRISAQQVSLYF